MRYLKILVLVLLLAALAAGIAAHLKREAIATGIANDLLAGSGLRVVDLAIDRLATDEIRFGRLVLEGDGARYDLRDLALPLALPDTRIRGARIGAVTVRPPAGSADPVRYSDLLAQALTLPARFPDLTVTVGRLEWADWPRLDDIHWQTRDSSQELRFVVDGRAGSLNTNGDERRAQIDIRLGGGSGSALLEASLEAVLTDPGYRVSGDVRLPAGDWLQLVRDARLEALPPEFAAVDLAADTHVALELTLDHYGENSATGESGEPVMTGDSNDSAGSSNKGDSADGRVGVIADISLADSHIRYAPTGDAFAADVRGLETVSLRATWPERQWRLQAGAFTLAVRHPSARDIGLQLSELACDPAQCTADVAIAIAGIATGGITAASFKSDMAVTVTPGAAWQVTGRPASLTASSLAGDGWRIGSLAMRSASAPGLQLNADGVRLVAQRAVVDLLEVAAAELAGDVRLQLEKLNASLGDASFDSAYVLPRERMRLSWQGETVVPADVRGRLTLAGSKGKGTVELADASRGLSAGFDLALAPEKVTAQLRDARIDFTVAPLSASFSRWSQAWNVVAGQLRADGTVTWQPDAAGGTTADLDFSLENGAAAWGELAATGINASGPLQLSPGTGLRAGPMPISAGLVDVGLPLANLRTEMSYESGNERAEIESLAFEVFGGKVSAPPFAVELDGPHARPEFRLEGVQLALIAALAEFEALEVTGALSGRVPVQVAGSGVTVSDGRLDSDAPGGVIRYRMGASGSNSSLALAQRALSNLHYESLGADVSYSAEGDLVMKLRLKGINPDMDPLQPVVLNLNVENNVPQLLKSLQAARDIQDVIESRTRGKPAAVSQ